MSSVNDQLVEIDARDSTVGARPGPVAWGIQDELGHWMVQIGPDMPTSTKLSLLQPLYTHAALASARADGVREGLEQAAKVPAPTDETYLYHAVGYTSGWHEALRVKNAAIRALINKDAGGSDAQ